MSELYIQRIYFATGQCRFQIGIFRKQRGNVKCCSWLSAWIKYSVVSFRNISLKIIQFFLVSKRFPSFCCTMLCGSIVWVGSSVKRIFIFLKLLIFCFGFQMHNLLIIWLKLIRNYKFAAFFLRDFCRSCLIITDAKFSPSLKIFSRFWKSQVSV
jgi:hypothetical protein